MHYLCLVVARQLSLGQVALIFVANHLQPGSRSDGLGGFVLVGGWRRPLRGLVVFRGALEAFLGLLCDLPLETHEVVGHQVEVFLGVLLGGLPLGADHAI